MAAAGGASRALLCHLCDIVHIGSRSHICYANTMSSHQINALATVNHLAELIGPASALDRIVGRLILTDPETLQHAATAELAAIDPDTDQGVF